MWNHLVSLPVPLERVPQWEALVSRFLYCNRASSPLSLSDTWSSPLPHYFEPCNLRPSFGGLLDRPDGQASKREQRCNIFERQKTLAIITSSMSTGFTTARFTLDEREPALNRAEVVREVPYGPLPKPLERILVRLDKPQRRRSRT